MVNPLAEGHVITDADVVSRCGWTPLNGFTVHHAVAMTFVNGSVAYADGKVSDTNYAERLTFNNAD